MTDHRLVSRIADGSRSPRFIGWYLLIFYDFVGKGTFVPRCHRHPCPWVYWAHCTHIGLPQAAQCNVVSFSGCLRQKSTSEGSVTMFGCSFLEWRMWERTITLTGTVRLYHALWLRRCGLLVVCRCCYFCSLLFAFSDFAGQVCLLISNSILIQ